MVRALSLETENEIDRVFRDMEFFEARRPELGAGVNPPDTVYFELEPEKIVVDGISLRETPRKRLNRRASIDT
jgi:hypothetical protein